MSEHSFQVGQKVIALVDMVNDLTDDGMGRELCATSGEELIIRRIGTGYTNCISVSHEHITDRSFCCAPDKIKEM